MTGIVLGFAGPIGSGKTTVSTAVAEALGWSRVGFGDFLREEARSRKLDDSSREVLQAIGEALIGAGWEEFCRAVLAQVNWMPGRSLVIDGIRHVEALAALRRIVAPTPLLLVYLEAADTARESRLRDKGIDDERRRRIESHSTEIEVMTMLLGFADYRVL